MRPLTVTIALLALALTITGCGEKSPDPIEQGIRCADAGGSWTWSEWSGYHCEFDANGQEGN